MATPRERPSQDENEGKGLENLHANKTHEELFELRNAIGRRSRRLRRSPRKSKSRVERQRSQEKKQEKRTHILRKARAQHVYLRKLIPKRLPIPASSIKTSNTPEVQNNDMLTCRTGALEKKKFGDLFTQYTGIRGEVPAEVNVNFHAQLELLWAKKIERFPGNKVVTEASQKILEKYRTESHETLTFEKYKAQVQAVVDTTKASISWEKVAEMKGLDKDQRKLAEKIVQGIDANGVIAYSLTELMPSANGNLNKDVLEFLLKYAGSKFVYSIPAIGDKMTSFGPYQFTSYALHDLPGDRRGASVINQALPKNLRIPGSVIMLEGNGHHRAAFLFMIDNICELVKRSGKAEGWKQLDKNQAHMKKQVIVFCAAAHHLPAKAKSMAQAWLLAGAEDPLMNYLNPHLKAYAKKTQANLEALNER